MCIRDRSIPLLEIKQEGKDILYRYANVVDGFNMPLRLVDSQTILYPTKEWKSIQASDIKSSFDVKVDPNYYIDTFVIK